MTNKRDWIIETLRALDEDGQWPGRFRAHKSLFLVDAFGLAKQPFRFELYQYGPYSFDLDAMFAQLEAEGDIGSSYPDPRYGARYDVSEATERDDFDSDSRNAIRKVATELKQLSTNDVELVATCIFVKKRLGVTGESDVIDRVKKIKPKYDDAQTRQAFRLAEEIESRLCPAG